jgi:hypothetical protein
MDGPLKVLLAIMLVVAPAAATPVALPSDSPGGMSDGTTAPESPQLSPVGNESGTSSYLALPSDDVQTARFGSIRLDAAGSVGVDNAALHGRYATIQLRESFTTQESRAAKREVVNRTADRLDARIADLTGRQQEAIEAYNSGELSTRGFLRELAIVDAHARSLRSTIDQLDTYTRSVGEPVPQTRIAQLKTRLIPLIGPVRNEVGDAMRGNGTDSPTRVYVETSSSGVVLAMLQQQEVGTAYVREAYDGEAFDDRFADNPISLDEFIQRADELYPWIAKQDRTRPNTVLTREPYYYRAGIYGIEYNHPHGTTRNDDLTMYYDAGTERVFREIQFKNVETIPIDGPTTQTEEGLQLQVSTTRGGGPVLVNVTDASTGDPVDATIRVNGEEVGSTMFDGRLWTVAPRDTFEVEAAVGSRNVTVVTSA